MNIDDLTALNRRILSQADVPNPNIDSVLNLLRICVAEMRLSATELRELAKESAVSAKGAHENPLDVAAINKEYLLYGRQTARDVVNGTLDGLVALNIDMQSARVLASLTTHQIAYIARHHKGTVFAVSKTAAKRVVELHPSALPHYSVAMLAAVA